MNAFYRILLLCSLSFFCLNQSTQAQEKYSISGYVKASTGGESIIRATITVSGKNIGVTTNDYGFYSLTLPKGKYTLIFSSAGHASKTIDILLTENTSFTAELADPVQLQDAIVTAQSSRARSIHGTQMGVEHIGKQEIDNVPMLFGERDVLKTMQLLPGVKSVSEGNNGLSVRGGATDQNLILLDEAPVYNASHLLGFFSTFNPDAVKDVTLYKGDMPAQYGGRLSSVVDVRMNEGNNQNFHVNGGIGLISARIEAEGPIEKDKSSFLFTARRTYADMFLKLSSDSTKNKNSLYFYDLNGKMNFTLGEHDKLYLSGYYGRDELSSSDIFGLNWGNATATLRWNHNFGPRMFSNTSLIFSNYDYRLNINNNGSDYVVKSALQDFHLKEEIQLYANPRNTLRFGFSSIHHTLNPGALSAKDSASGVNDSTWQKRYGLENAVYISNDWKASDRLTVTYGARAESFSAIGLGDFPDVAPSGQITKLVHNGSGQFLKTYINPEFRLALSYQLNPTSSIKASYTDNTQNMHLLASGTPGLPTDRWLLTDNMVKPERSHQVSLGYYKNLDDDKYELTVETYYKDLRNQIDYRDGADVLTTQYVESQLLYGKGRAYGVEWLLKKKQGKLTGWIGYTLSKSELKIDGINNNRWYDATQDRTHDITIVGMYHLNKKWQFSANWVYNTGNAVSFPSGKYQSDGRTIYYYSERNGYRMPAYHRLDLSATMQLRQRKRYSSELAFGVYNAYARDNAFTITFRDNKNDPTQTQAVQTTLFSAVPFISYNFKF